MKDYVVSYGQSIYDIAVQFYGDLSSKVWDIIDDNNLSDGLDTDLEGGQVLKIREGVEMVSNNISEYFVRFPAVVNNSDNESTGIIGVLKIILKQIGNETNGDGFILIDIIGGKAPFEFQWRNQADDSIISSSQNLVAVSSGTYSVTVIDHEGTEVTLNNLTISAIDNTIYLVDDDGNFITDENGNPIIV